MWGLIALTHGPGSPISLAVAPSAQAAVGVDPALAHHRCCRPDLGPTLDRPESLSGRWRVAGRGLCVNCSLHLNMQNIIISVKTIIIIIIIRDSPLSKLWLPCFLNSVLHWVRYEHSVALVAKKKIYILLVTLLSHRGTDKYFLL